DSPPGTRSPAHPSPPPPHAAAPAGDGAPAQVRARDVVPADTAFAGNVTIASAETALPAPAAAAIPGIPAELHDQTWLKTRRDSEYVVQLLGTREPAALGKFARDHALGERAAWFATRHRGAPWYVLVYGPFPDRASARDALSSLPTPLRATSPWPRSLADIKASIDGGSTR
ncbi:MAG: SPOR domain-containing protein, partial [Gammaproteobacteria bacterium]|nr:SPOR domain-containing protein [Gammaproteobacteria bacterium]